jgi:hypothetical protein
MKLMIPIIAGLLMAACELVETPPERAKARIALFRECMELAGKMKRQADDDVSDVVSECSTQSLYMTNYIR